MRADIALVFEVLKKLFEIIVEHEARALTLRNIITLPRAHVNVRAFDHDSNVAKLTCLVGVAVGVLAKDVLI